MPIYKKFDKTFFKKWSGDMAYVLGFLFADGNIIQTKRGTHFVGIYTADKHLLVSIKKCIGAEHKISVSRSETGATYKIQIGSKQLFHDLVLLGLTPNKAKRMKFPKIPQKYEPDFIRGYFDGDGNVWMGAVHKKRKKQHLALQICFTSASYNFLFELFLSIKKSGISGGSLRKSKTGNYSRLSFGTSDSLKLYNFMYNGTHKLFLPRKKLVFEKYMRA